MTIRIDGTNTAANPGITGTDTDTGLQFGTDEVNIVTGGSTRATVDSSGRVGIGTPSPSQLLEINGASTPGVQIKDTTNNVIARIGANDNTGLVGTRSNHPTVFQINDAEVARLDTSGNLQFNSGYGSVATAYGVRAWVNFNGTGTPAIRDNGNVSSITDNGTGDYTANFTTAMPDDDYCILGSIMGSTDPGYLSFTCGSSTAPSTSAVRFNVANYGGSLYDLSNVCMAVIR